MKSKSETLLTLATEQFGELTTAERMMLEAAGDGKVANCNGDGIREQDCRINARVLLVGHRGYDVYSSQSA